jgi:hypothetical protein
MNGLRTGELALSKQTQVHPWDLPVFLQVPPIRRSPRRPRRTRRIRFLPLTPRELANDTLLSLRRRALRYLIRRPAFHLEIRGYLQMRLMHFTVRCTHTHLSDILPPRHLHIQA